MTTKRNGTGLLAAAILALPAILGAQPTQTVQIPEAAGS